METRQFSVSQPRKHRRSALLRPANDLLSVRSTQLRSRRTTPIRHSLLYEPQKMPIECLIPQRCVPFCF